jgi:MinD superfamily P-loop ATPase
MGDDGVLNYAEAENIPILMEIPFDRGIAESYSRGDMIVDVMPEWKEKFVQLSRDIKAIAERKRGAS